MELQDVDAAFLDLQRIYQCINENWSIDMELTILFEKHEIAESGIEKIFFNSKSDIRQTYEHR